MHIGEKNEKKTCLASSNHNLSAVWGKKLFNQLIAEDESWDLWISIFYEGFYVMQKI